MEPQNEQWSALSVTGAGSGWPVAADGRGSRRGPDRRRGPQLPLELHEAPDPGAVDPKVGLEVGGGLMDSVEVDAEQLAHRSSEAAIGRVRVGSWASQAGMPGRVNEQVFGHQWGESGEQHGHDIEFHGATQIWRSGSCW